MSVSYLCFKWYNKIVLFLYYFAIFIDANFRMIYTEENHAEGD